MAKLIDMFGTECDYLYSIDSLYSCSHQVNGLALVGVPSRTITDFTKTGYYITPQYDLITISDECYQRIFDLFCMETIQNPSKKHIKSMNIHVRVHEISVDTFNMFMIKYG